MGGENYLDNLEQLYTLEPLVKNELTFAQRYLANFKKLCVCQARVRARTSNKEPRLADAINRMYTYPIDDRKNLLSRLYPDSVVVVLGTKIW